MFSLSYIEEKCNEFLRQISCQEPKLGYMSSEQSPPVHSLGTDDLQYRAVLKELGTFLTEGGSDGVSDDDHDDNEDFKQMDCDQQPLSKTREQARPVSDFSSPPFAAAASTGGRNSSCPFPTSASHTLCRSNSSGEASEGVNRLLWDSAAIYSDARPPSNFVVYNANSRREEGPPLFDGSVANATPPPLGGISAGPSGGSGTILHLACALDLPLALAFLLATGADARSSHTAFRRLMIHEAACNGSIQCLTLLLELGRCCAQSGEDDEKVPWLQYLPDSARQTSPNDIRFFPDRFRNEQRKSPPEFHRSRGLCSHSSMPSPSKCKGDFLTFLRLFRDYTALVSNGYMTELDAARSIMSQAYLAESSKVSLAHSCAFQKGSIALSRGIFRPRGGGCADGHGNTPLHWAAFKNEVKCVRLLLQYNADANARAHPSGWTPLHDAAYSNSREVINLLIDSGAHVDARANSGATPLCFAAQEDSAEAALLLLQRGADLATRCAGGPYFRNADQHGFGVHNHHPHSRFSGYTPLHYCAHYNAHRAARVLLQHPVARKAMDIPDLSERLPIHVAVARGSSDVLRELLHAGARIETRKERCSLLYAQRRPQSSGSTSSNESPSTPRHRQVSDEAPETPTRVSPSVSDISTVSATPVSSPVLRAMIPSQPITSSKPWNCLSQQNIDECRELISHAERNWAPDRHLLFTPADRRAVLELLRVGKRLEQQGTGIFIDLWPEVLSFCGRGWFELEKPDDEEDEGAVPMEECVVPYGHYQANDEDLLMLPSLSR